MPHQITKPAMWGAMGPTARSACGLGVCGRNTLRTDEGARPRDALGIARVKSDLYAELVLARQGMHFLNGAGAKDLVHHTRANTQRALSRQGESDLLDRKSRLLEPRLRFRHLCSIGFVLGRYVVSYLLRFVELDDDRKDDDEARFLSWENTILGRASTLDEAYKNGMTVARENAKPCRGRSHQEQLRQSCIEFSEGRPLLAGLPTFVTTDRPAALAAKEA